METAQKLSYVATYPIREILFKKAFRQICCEITDYDKVEIEKFIVSLYQQKYSIVRFVPSELYSEFGKLKAGMIVKMAMHSAKKYNVLFSSIPYMGRHSVKQKVRDSFKINEPLDKTREHWAHQNVMYWNIIAGLKWEAGIFNQTILKNANILDYGCNIGSLTYLAHAFGISHATMVDVSGAPLDFADSFLNENAPSLSREVIHVNSEETPDLGYNRFEIVYCNDVLEHVPNPLTVVNNIYKCLKSNGLFYTNFLHVPDTLGGCNLKSAQSLRGEVLKFIKENFEVIDWDEKKAEYILRKP